MNRAIRVLAICIAMVVALNFGMVECKALEEGAAVGVDVYKRQLLWRLDWD